MGQDANSLNYDKNSKIWTIQTVDQAGVTHTFTANHVVSSAPVCELLDKLQPSPISRLHGHQLKYRDFFVVALICNKPDMFPDNWIYIHDPSVKVGRVQNFRSWSPELVPQEGMSCLGLEYFCFEGDGLWNSADKDLVALATKECVKIGLIDAEHVVDACVVRQHKAYPVYDEEYKSHVSDIRRDMEQNYPSLHMVGRNGMHKYNNQDHAMMTAILTAKNIQAGKRIHDIWNVNEDAEYHEAGSSGEQEALKSERLVPRKVA
jgi:protoporphyrinogen oxidase